MNCQEIQQLVEEAIDNRLSGSCAGKVARHLARCASCKALFAAQKSEHAAWFRALNDVSDIPPPATSSAVLAARLASAAVPAAKRAGSIAVPLWVKRAAAITLLCGGAALAAWIGTTMESRHLGGETPTPTPEGEPQVKQTLLAASAAITLAATPALGSSSAEATFDSFSSEFRTSVTAEAGAFLSRYRTIEDSGALASFNSTEPKGLVILFH